MDDQTAKSDTSKFVGLSVLSEDSWKKYARSIRVYSSDVHVLRVSIYYDRQRKPQHNIGLYEIWQCKVGDKQNQTLLAVSRGTSWLEKENFKYNHKNNCCKISIWFLLHFILVNTAIYKLYLYLHLLFWKSLHFNEF